MLPGSIPPHSAPDTEPSELYADARPGAGYADPDNAGPGNAGPGNAGSGTSHTGSVAGPRVSAS